MTKRKQFPNVSSPYGAPMGRPCYGHIEDCEDGSIAVERVWLDEGGYDSGDAYWGTEEGKDKLYWAHDNDDQYQCFCRAGSRDEAVSELGIPAEKLVPVEFQLELRDYLQGLLFCSAPDDMPYYRDFSVVDPDEWMDEFDIQTAAGHLRQFELVLKDGGLWNAAVEQQSLSQIAHDFALTRQGAGAGFWDGGYGDELGERLTALAKRFGEFYFEIKQESGDSD